MTHTSLAMTGDAVEGAEVGVGAMEGGMVGKAAFFPNVGANEYRDFTSPDVGEALGCPVGRAAGCPVG